MTDLLPPAEVRKMQEIQEQDALLRDSAWFAARISRLCRNYITLWDELEHERELHDKAVERVTQLEQMMGALGR